MKQEKGVFARFFDQSTIEHDQEDYYSAHDQHAMNVFADSFQAAMKQRNVANTTNSITFTHAACLKCSRYEEELAAQMFKAAIMEQKFDALMKEKSDIEAKSEEMIQQFHQFKALALTRINALEALQANMDN